MSKLPICVDLDGTLIYNDVTAVSLSKYVSQGWVHWVEVIKWFILGGRARVKYELALRVSLSVGDLKFNNLLLSYLKEKRMQGHKIILATACSQKYAEQIANHLKIFDQVFSSNISVNLRGPKKAEALIKQFGDKQFIYAGNSYYDIYIWKHAALAIISSPTLLVSLYAKFVTHLRIG